MIDIKFPEEARTFETRLQFLISIYSNKYDNVDIMKKCIEHKLNRNLDFYTEQLERSYAALSTEKAIKVLKKVK